MITYNSDDPVSPLEIHILHHAKSKGRIFDSKNISIFIHEVISMLINNMPLDDEMRYGEINDLACTVLEGASSRINSLFAMNELTKQ